MNCCSHCSSMNELFDRARADKARKRYERKGPDGPTKALLGAIVATDRVAGRTVLDVGGGVGVIGAELSDRGAAAVVNVESSPEFAAVAGELARARGSGDRTRVNVGDFVALAPKLDDADIVALHRVVCCYPDYDALLTAAARRARDVVAFSFPRDRWYVRAVVGLVNLRLALAGGEFRVFVHSPAAMREVLEREGLDPVSESGTPAWRVEVWGRSAARPAG